MEWGCRLAGYGRGVIVVLDRELGYRNQPSQDRFTNTGLPIHINAHGLRDAEFPEAKPAGEYRILVLGDSLTFGIDVAQDDTFCRRVDAALAGRCGRERVRLINAGVQGYDSKQERDYLLHRGLALDPDLVLVAFYGNDAEFNERLALPKEFPLRSSLRHLAVYEAIQEHANGVLARRRGSLGQSDQQRQNAEILRQYVGTQALDPSVGENQKKIKVCAAILKEMHQACRTRGIGFGVLVLPGFAMTRDPATPSLQSAVGWELGQAGVPTLNLLPALRGHHPQCWLAHDEGHFSSAGHTVVAEAIEAWLVALKDSELARRPPWRP